MGAPRAWCAGLLTAYALVLWPGAARAQNESIAYEISARLDPSTHQIVGSERLRWRNPTPVALDQLQLHLYLNAFAGTGSTFLREMSAGGAGRGRFGALGEDGWGWIRLTRLETATGVDLLPGLEFISPDDGNPDDRTLARVVLPEPLPGGAVLELEIDFEARLPRLLARTGWEGAFHMVGQWYPKPAVLEPREEAPPRWRGHQFHANSEFFADFAAYRVTLAVPEGWSVGATGVEVKRVELEDGMQEVTFRAERVHDFAWCAAPADVLQVVEAEFDPTVHVPQEWVVETAALLGRAPADLELAPTSIRLLVPPARAPLVERQLRAARLALAFFGLRYGAYPYPQLTLVDPPLGARGAAGMEYPTLATTGGGRWLLYPPLRWLPQLETVTVHEIAHQWFYGILGFDEFTEPWLDEGLATYAENECLQAVARGRLVPELPPVDPWFSTLAGGLLFDRDPQPLTGAAWSFRTAGSYGRTVYGRSARVLRTLERLLGRRVFARGLRAFVREHAYGHPGGDDLRRALEASSGTSLGWFWRQAVEGDAVADWGVAAVRHRRSGERRGLDLAGEAWVAATDEGGEGWLATVDLVRRGTLEGPVEVEIRLADGSVLRRTWAGRTAWARWELEVPERVTAVRVDPHWRWAIESERADNSWSAEPAGPGDLVWWLPLGARLLLALPLTWS